MSKQRLRIGIMGLGRIGLIHFDNLIHLGREVEVLAVSDPDEDKLTLASDRGVPYVFKNSEELLFLEGLDAVLICTPTTTHYDLFITACQRKLHIFCEKPLDTSLSRIRELEDAAEKAGIIVQVGFQRRYDQNFQSVKNKLSLGRIGEPHLMKITSRDPAPPSIDFIKSSGGIFMDMTIHDFDMARFLMGCEVTEVFAWGDVRVDPRIGAAGDIDTAVVSLRFENRALAVIDNSRQAVYGYDQRVEVFGSAGMTQTFNNRPDNLISHDETGAQLSPPYYFFLERYAQAYRSEIVSFIDSMTQNKPVLAGINDAYMSTGIALAAQLSLSDGRPVSINEII